MVRHVRLRELLLGVEGLALLRHLYDGADADADQRLSEVRRFLEDDAFSSSEIMTEADPRTGYRAWSDRYDEPGNPIIGLEEPVVRSITDTLPPGRALDAATGTGRHARHLAGQGHAVVGVDLTLEMLRHAAPETGDGSALVQADLRRIPAASESFELVVCGLALAHVADLPAAVAELGRVLRPSGRLVVSVLHPFQAFLGWHAPFEDAEGQRRFVREYAHSHADYVAAFAAAGLRVRGCLEPRLSVDAVQAKRRAYRHIPDATLAAYADLPAVLVWDAEKV
jgi:SAM-dependent methyltransferase